jgi:CRISPR/Cas system-associated exonuclease Cas4 (RecB family)
MFDFNKVIDVSHLRPWSFSKVQKAKKCQYEFFFKYVEKIEPEEKADFLILGNGVHFVLESALNVAFKRRKPINKELLYYFAKLFKEEEPEIDFKAMEAFFPNIVKFVNGQLRRIEGSSFVASEMELAVNSSFSSVSFHSNDVFLRGKLDFLFSKGDTLYIIDHKTNRNSDFSNKIKTQLRWYALLASVKFPQFYKFALEVHNVRYGTVNRIIFTSRDIEIFKLKLIPVLEILESDLIGKSFRELQPNPNELNCRWCEYKNICPEAKRD